MLCSKTVFANLILVVAVSQPIFASNRAPSPSISGTCSDDYTGAIEVIYDVKGADKETRGWITNLFYAISFPEPHGDLRQMEVKKALRQFNAQELTAYMQHKGALCPYAPLPQAIFNALTLPAVNYLPIITLLLQSKHFNINQQDEFPVGQFNLVCTPLFAAVANYRFGLANLLRRYGADPSIKTETEPSKQESLIEYAQRTNDKKILTWLTAKPQAASLDEKTPLKPGSSSDDDDCCHCCFLDWLFGH